jgi:ATP-binding cassette, subfamily C, bacteriocin exporter
MWKRYVCVRQQDPTDCGAASLATIAKHYGRSVDVRQLREISGTDQFGANLQGLQEAAVRIGFAARAVKGPWTAIRGVPVPVIAHMKLESGTGHYVVVHCIDDRHVTIADPENGIRVLSHDEFQSLWDGYLLLVAPDPNASQDTVDMRSSSPSRRLFGLLQLHVGTLTELLFCTVVMTLMGISSSYFVQHLVDSVLTGRQTRMLDALGVAMALILVFRIGLSILRQYLLAHLARTIELSLMSRFMRHLLNLPQQYFETRQVGEIIARVHDASKVRDVLSGTALTLIVDGVIVVFTGTILWLYDGPLALVATLFAPILILAVLLHHPASRRTSQESMDASAKLTAHLVENVSGVATVKAFCIQDRCATENEHRLVRMAKALFNFQLLNLSLTTTGSLITGVAGLTILWVGGHRVIDGALTIGELMFFYTLLGYMLEPLQRLAGINLQIQDALVAADRLFQVMDMPTETNTVRGARFSHVNRCIEFRDVSFRYGFRKNVLDEISLTIPAGTTMAIVGASGCGKSTLLKLLMRFYEPTEGAILIDGVDSRDFDLHQWRSHIGLVSQDPLIFSGSIRENIAMGKPDASFNEIIEAARAAGLDSFIGSLPNRFEAVIGEGGSNLSGGQRQRLAIARALLCDPEILLFDEATSHLDTKTEQLIQQNLKQAFAGRTVLVVAHRLSTIRQSDLICVMDGGHIAEMGTHEELLALNGHYATLWSSQLMDESNCTMNLKVN